MYVDAELSHSHIYIYADYKEISDKTFTAETLRGIHQWKKHSEFSLSLSPSHTPTERVHLLALNKFLNTISH